MLGYQVACQEGSAKEEDEAFQAALRASAEAVAPKWSCAACTLLNPEPLVECAACGGRERAARPPGGGGFGHESIIEMDSITGRMITLERLVSEYTSILVKGMKRADLVERLLERLPIGEAQECLSRLDDRGERRQRIDGPGAVPGDGAEVWPGGNARPRWRAAGTKAAHANNATNAIWTLQLYTGLDVLAMADAQARDLADECGFTQRQCDAVLLDDVAWRAKYGKEHEMERAEMERAAELEVPIIAVLTTESPIYYRISGKKIKRFDGDVRDIHFTISCDGCQMSPIVGTRWKCNDCANYDLCDACHTSFSEIHGQGHTFRQQQPIHHLISCDGCQMSPIVGKRWKCNDCANYDLCDACLVSFSQIHGRGHTFSQFGDFTGKNCLKSVIRNELKERFEFLEKVRDELRSLAKRRQEQMLISQSLCAGVRDVKALPTIDNIGSLLVMVVGVVGKREDLLNGVYNPTGDLYNDKPLFRKQNDSDMWLRFDTDENWSFSNTQDKDANNVKSCCSSVQKGKDHPTQVDMWKIHEGETNDEFEEHAPMKCIVAPNTVTVDGVVGKQADLLNGVYEATGDFYNGKPLFRKQIDSDWVWLRFSTVNSWIFSDTVNKDANNDVGWCHSESDIDHPTKVKSWNIWANGADEKWEVHAAMKCMRRCEELYRSLIKGKLLLGSMGLKLAPEHISKLIQMAMRCDDNFDNSQGNLADIIKCLQTPGQAVKGLDIALKSLDFHAPIYCVLAILNLKMGIKQVSIQVDKYLQQLLASTDDHDYIDPMLYYVYYLTWRKCGSNSKSDRVRAAFALTALRCFPVFAKNWVDVDDDIDAIVKAEGLMEEDEVGGRGRGGMGNSSAFRKICPVDMDDNHDELDEEPFTNDSPDAEWQIAKSDHQLRSEGMDQLMALTGLQDIKKKAMEIVKAVLLNKGRPASLKADVAMNFLFTGNPGCGKTTVANLLTRAMNQLGFRKNNTMIETSAQDILKLKNPGTDFADMMKQATGGCLFIDEAYRFSPAPAGQQPNASNEVLDYLLEAIEKPEIRSTTTVILAGYRDEIETLLAYNVGFASRFNREFCFPDYTEVQLCKIFLGMVKDRGFLLERKKDCGVSIGAVMANRIHSGAGKKGFGNAREVRNKVEEVIAKQSDRLGTMMLQKKPVSERDYKLLLAVDSVGVRPDFNRSPTMRQLETMMGLNKVKEHFRNLMDMATQNFDREMRGEKPNLISLHRVFYGNPGTGKTTVSELYGALLKELGYLSKGDFIRVTPADLTGEAEGGAATNTKAVLEKARGKVLLIDEAYVLDPKRKNNIYGGNVLDTLVEKLDGEAGSDCAVILAGYRREMFAMLENNHGLHRRFNIDDFGIFFEDMEDEELRQVLVSGVGKEGLAFSNLLDIDLVLNRIAQKRRMPGFGNAATVNSMINVAKVAKSKRLGEAKKAYDVAIKEGRVPEPLPNPDLLLLSDFIQNEEDAASARNVFANLYNMDHIVEVLDELESIIVQAKADGREPADVLANNHMVFIGPPGTGKTTVAMKFGKLLKDLNILPSDNLTHVTGTSLQGQYIGETKEKVLKAMHQARGGILFIDEAYGLAGGNYSKGTCPYAKEAVETLVGAITEPEFKGNMLVIMAGYEEEIDQMFASVNPGFASRYNKRRVRFLPWTAKQAADAVVEEINKKKEKEGTITDEAICCLFDCCVQMQPLPGSGPTRASWASARDVIELILPALYSQRAKRLVATGKVLAAAGIEKDDGEKAGVSKACLRKSAQVGLVPPPYELADVKLALSPIVASRKKILGYEVYSPPELQVSIPTKSIDEALGGLDPRKAPKVKNKTKIQNYQDEDENGVSDDVIWAALEQTCVDLGYSEEDIVEMLKPGGDYKHDLLARIVQITGCSDMAKIRAVIDRQKHALLVRMEAIMEQRKKQKSEEEKKIQEKIKRIGRCPMDYEWLKVEGGYRCAGGSHFCTDEQIKAFCF